MRKKINSLIVTVLAAAIPFCSLPLIYAGPIMDRLCSSFANVLDNEETKAAAAAKSCKKNCALIQKKHDLIKAAQKKVDDSCAKNIAPDITKVSAGLDKNVQAKLRKQYNQHSKMYDGTADFADKDFGLTTNSNQSPVLGKGGQVTDLKTSDPDINKTPTEFSLSGTKLSGETPGQTTTKQSPILLASASSAKSPTDTGASAPAVGSTQKAEAASENTLPVCSEGATICAGGGGLSCQKPCQSPSDPEAPGWLMSCVSGDDCVGEGGCSAGYVQTPSGCCLASQVTTTGICCSPEQAPAADGTCGCPKKCPKDWICTIAKKCEDSKKRRSLTESEVKKLNDLADYYEKIGLGKDATLLRKLLKEGSINTDPNLKVLFMDAGGYTNGWTGKITIRTEFLEGPVESLVVLMAHELDHSRRISEAGFWRKVWYNSLLGYWAFEKRGDEAGENAWQLMKEWVLQQSKNI